MSSRSLTRLSLALALACLGPTLPTVQAGVLAGAPDPTQLTLEEALELCFPKAEVERGTVYLTEDQLRRARKLSGVPIEGAIVHPYRATRDGVDLGTAWVDVHRVRSLREVLLIVVGPDQRVRRIELLEFAEPKEYAPRASWYGQFTGRRLDDELDLRRGIRGITGATLTARATTAAVRRALALQRVVDGPPPPDPPVPGSAVP